MLQPKIFVCVHKSESKSYWLIFRWIFRAGAMVTRQLLKSLLKSKLFGICSHSEGYAES